MKTMLKPMMKAAELSITLRKSWPSFIFSCSTPTPEISETYPGTSGSTQGDRNENNPATKAASGNGKLVIFIYCSGLIVTTAVSPAHPPYKMRRKGELLQHFRLRRLDDVTPESLSGHWSRKLFRNGRLFRRCCGRGGRYTLEGSFRQNLLHKARRNG